MIIPVFKTIPRFRVYFILSFVFIGGFAGRRAMAQGDTSRRYTEIRGTGQTLYSIAIPKLNRRGNTHAQADTLKRVLSNDLSLIGLFKILDARGFLADLAAEGTGIVVQRWRAVGAQAVVKATVSARGRTTSVTWFLYDLGRGARPMLRKTYSGQNIRKLAHRFGDDIVKYYTNERGVFLSRIAFTATHRSRRRSQIYTMDFDGHGAHQVSRTGRQNVLPDWSPNGALAYTSYLWQNPDLYVLARGNRRARRVSRHPGLNSGAAWSPNGREIALTLTKDGNPEIYIINANGAIRNRVTRSGAIDTSPTWSPDGQKLAFVSNRGGSPQIYVVSARGGRPRRLTFAGNYNQEPAWCPRPNKPLVAFSGRDGRGHYDIFTVDVTSGAIKRLTQGQGRRNESPSWSPSGRLLVFSSSRGGLWLMDTDGNNQKQIFRGAASSPAWSAGY